MKKRLYRLYGCNEVEILMVQSAIDADDTTYITIEIDENDEWYVLVPITFWALIKWRIAFFIENIRTKRNLHLVKDKS